MPELPEVETIRRDLEKKVVGARLRRVEVLFSKVVTPPPLQFIEELKGAVVKKINRRGKLLEIEVGTGSLFIHLKMTGQLVLRHKRQIIAGGHPISGLTTVPNQHTHVVFYFTNGDALYFNDSRKFGYLKFLPKEKASHLWSHLGVDPLSLDFTQRHFLELLQTHSLSRLKPFLLNQEYVSGLGNIYVDETCFRAGVRPTRRVGSLSLKEKIKLWRSIRTILRLSLRHRGTSFNTYVDGAGERGNFRPYLRVYGRKGEACPICQTKIVRTVVGGRGTHYCPRCQR